VFFAQRFLTELKIYSGKRKLSFGKQLFQKSYSANEKVRQAQKKQQYQDEVDRIAIEGKFGQGKRRFGLARVMFIGLW